MLDSPTLEFLMEAHNGMSAKIVENALVDDNNPAASFPELSHLLLLISYLDVISSLGCPWRKHCFKFASQLPVSVSPGQHLMISQVRYSSDLESFSLFTDRIVGKGNKIN